MTQEHTPCTISIIFDGFPNPVGPRFIEVEDSDGKSISIGQWVSRDDGLTELRVPISNTWRPLVGANLRDITVNIAVKRRDGKPMFRDETYSVYPAYIDDDGRLCDAGTWAPEAGFEGPHFTTEFYQPMPTPPTALSELQP